MKSIVSRARVAALLAIAVSAAMYPMATVAKACSRVVELVLQPHAAAFGSVLGSNTLTSLIPTIYEALDTISRELVGFTQAVTLDSGIERAAVGQPIMSSVVQPGQLINIVPGLTAPNAGDHVFSGVPLTLSKSMAYPIRWNGEEQRAVSGANGGIGSQRLMRDQFTQAFRALGNAIDRDVAIEAVTHASRAIGTPGTAPFGVAGDLSDFALSRKVLTDNGAPLTNLRMVLNSDSTANIRGKQSVLFKVNEAGTDELLRRAIIGRVQDFDISETAQLTQIVKGTGAGYLVNAPGGLPVGTTVIPVDTGTGTINAGDAINFAGDARNYMVNSAAAGGFVTIGGPGLLQPLADNVAITVGASYMPNVAFSKSALLLATRTPAMPVGLDGRAMDMADDRIVVTDPVSGISFEIVQYRQYRQIYWEVAAVWGFKAIKPDHIVVLRG